MITIMFSSLASLFKAGRTVSLEATQVVFRTGDRVQLMYLVNKGQIDLIRHTSSGKPLIVNRAGPGTILAEASAYSDSYHCDGEAKAHSQLSALPVSVFLKGLHNSPDAARSWAAQLARELQRARMQSEIRSLNTVAERLDAWLGHDDALPPKGHIQDLARMLGVSREALYRELARRRIQANGKAKLPRPEVVPENRTAWQRSHKAVN